MGLDTAAVEFLCAARSMGVDFSDTLMIGRQSLFPDARSLQRVFSVLGVDQTAESFLREHAFGEEFFTALGARQIDSLDYSAYEGATIVHDMNTAITPRLHHRFSVVYDGGTLEHVFNVPVALKNSMEMVQLGGHFVQVNIANNFMGHGFWQFSPELLFRVFSPTNGFEIEALLLHEVVPEGAWYRVDDPDQIRQRVELCNEVPTYICTVAKRVSMTDIFATPPMQSDYTALWDQAAHSQSRTPLAPAQDPSNSGKVASADEGRGARLRRYLPALLTRIFRSLRQRLRPSQHREAFDRPYYSRVALEALLRGRVR